MKKLNPGWFEELECRLKDLETCVGTLQTLAKVHDKELEILHQTIVTLVAAND